MTIDSFHVDEEIVFAEEKSNQQIEEIISVSQAIRLDFGNPKVKGTIIGVSKVFKMISKIEFYCDDCHKLNELIFSYPEFIITDFKKKCDKCGKVSKNELNLDFKNAVIVELQDTETFNDMDRLTVFIFDKDTEGIRVGETVIITGDIQIQQNGKKKYFTYLYAESIKYLNREDLTLTRLDIEAIKRFASIRGQNNIIDELVSLFDHSIVGYKHVKQGLLYTTVNTSEKITKSEHLDALLIGDPGLAKTRLLKTTTELVPGSSMESAQSSSGKSLTAIIEKTDNDTFLRLGAVPRARGAICGLNEFARMSMDDQALLLDVMQERRFTINKFGINSRIQSPTTILGSANPIKSKWKDNDKVDLNEFMILDPIIDRFDYIFVFKSRKNEKEISEFMDKFSEIEDKKDKGQLPDYTPFLVKYIQYAKQFNTIIITDEAAVMIREFAKRVNIQGFGSPRVLATLRKTIKAIARLKLKNVADGIDAKEAMEFYNVLLLDFQKSVVVSQSPKEVAYNESVSILKENKGFGYSLEELFVTVCKRNNQVAIWLGYDKNRSLKIADNHKSHDVYNILLNHSHIKVVQENPVVLKWFKPDQPDASDVTSDIENKKYNHKNNNDISESTSGSSDTSGSLGRTENNFTNNCPESTSHASHTSHSNSNNNNNNNESASKPSKCYYCPAEFNIEQEHLKHSLNNHPNKPAQPTREFIEHMKKEWSYDIQLKGNPCE